MPAGNLKIGGYVTIVTNYSGGDYEGRLSHRRKYINTNSNNNRKFIFKNICIKNILKIRTKYIIQDEH